MIKPSCIATDHRFMGSPFKNSECETVLRNIVLLQKNNNLKEWTPFSWDDYLKFCTHNPTESERGVLDAMVNGGRPVLYTSANLESGWLSFSDKKYSFTKKIIDMLENHFVN